MDSRLVSEPAEAPRREEDLPGDRRRPPAWAGEMARQALANALGTLIAALVLFLGGVILGAIPDVPTRAVLAASGALLSLLGVAIGVARLARVLPRYQRA